MEDLWLVRFRYGSTDCLLKQGVQVSICYIYYDLLYSSFPVLVYSRLFSFVMQPGFKRDEVKRREV